MMVMCMCGVVLHLCSTDEPSSDWTRINNPQPAAQRVGPRSLSTAPPTSIGSSFSSPLSVSMCVCVCASALHSVKEIISPNIHFQPLVSFQQKKK